MDTAEGCGELRLKKLGRDPERGNALPEVMELSPRSLDLKFKTFSPYPVPGYSGICCLAHLETIRKE